MSVYLNDQPLHMTVLDEAFCSQFRYDRSNHKIFGCIYDRHGSRVNDGIRIGGHVGDVIINGDPETAERPAASVRLEGTTVYLGNLMSQYGHFITEGISTLWPLPNLRFDRAFFHPFIFGDNIPEFMKPIHNLFGLDHVEVIVSRQGFSFERLIIPDRTLVLNKSAHIEHRRTIARIVDEVAGKVRPKPSRRVFVSRSELKDDRRAFANNSEVDRLAESLGFDIVHPQNIDIESQIRLFDQTLVLARSSGSALHNCLFQQPGSFLIEIGSARLPNASHPMQRLCNMLAQVKEAHIQYRVKESLEVDLDFLKRKFLEFIDEVE